jgi:hypothetical protein
MKMKDLDSMDIEKLIRLPFFYSLKISNNNDGIAVSSKFWEIKFKCNRVTENGGWSLLDAESDSEYITRYRIIEPNYK